MRAAALLRATHARAAAPPARRFAQRADAVVVGAGLAGAAAAYHLSEFMDVRVVTDRPPLSLTSAASTERGAAFLKRLFRPRLFAADETLDARRGRGWPDESPLDARRGSAVETQRPRRD